MNKSKPGQSSTPSDSGSSWPSSLHFKNVLMPQAPVFPGNPDPDDPFALPPAPVHFNGHITSIFLNILLNSSIIYLLWPLHVVVVVVMVSYLL
jgi:hypothetical protein